LVASFCRRLPTPYRRLRLGTHQARVPIWGREDERRGARNAKTQWPLFLTCAYYTTIHTLNKIKVSGGGSVHETAREEGVSLRAAEHPGVDWLGPHYAVREGLFANFLWEGDSQQLRVDQLSDGIDNGAESVELFFELSTRALGRQEVDGPFHSSVVRKRA
jgi:hypothetical protein